ncbi:MAG: thiamine pyrophosphate-dependent enzyme [Gemmataceae bacterium]
MDVTVSQCWATEVFTTLQPPHLLQSDQQPGHQGWSIPAALGQRVMPGRQVLTITGDGCFLMSAMEISTAARAGLPVKFFVLDDQAYHYMQELQRAAYLRTTATILARLDYRALAQGWGVAYQEITANDQLEPRILGSLTCDGPVLTRVLVDYRDRPVRWIDAARAKYFRELTNEQKIRFAARVGTRTLNRRPDND